MEHAKVSEFFPKPSEILGLINTWRMVERQKGEEHAKREDEADRERRIASGEQVYGWGDAIQEFQKVINAKPDLTDQQKTELTNKLEKLNKGKMAS